MLNQIILCGRLVETPEVKELEEGKKVAIITIAVPRSYKNADGIYDTDFIDCVLYNGVAENTKEYCRKGDILGIKGRIQTEVENDKKTMQIIAEKVTFLSSRKENE